MTQNITPNEKLINWWTETTFDAKEYYYLKDNGDLILKQSPYHPERIIAGFNPENAAVVLNALTEKFAEVTAKVQELAQEWQETTDKLKLSGKINRIKEYLLHTNAVGDFNSLFSTLQEWEASLNTLEEQNYRQRVALVSLAEELAGTKNNTWKDAAQKLKEISNQWRELGYVDKHKGDELWLRLEKARDAFFERKREFQEEQAKEMLHNLDLKIEIVDKAEILAASDHWKETTESYRKLMEEWKAIGRTPHDKNEELWHRFILAKNTFYERKKAHFEKIQSEQEANYTIKLALVEKAEAMKESKDWNGTSRAYAQLMDEWKNTGRVPPDKTDELWNRLNAAKDHFFNSKREQMELSRVEQEDNYAQKLALVKRAETIKESSQWREVTEEMNELMEEWKKIGPVPRTHAHTVWEQFISARKYFFERKDANREQRRQYAEKQVQYKLDQTKNFLHKLKQEYREENERIHDFKQALENITPGNKEEELRNHLHKLISQSEIRIEQKTIKINDVTRELEELEEKHQTRAVSEKKE